MSAAPPSGTALYIPAVCLVTAITYIIAIIAHMVAATADMVAAMGADGCSHERTWW